MSWRLRWLIIAPVLLFVIGTVVLSSCGGGSGGCAGTFNNGIFEVGVCPSPGPGVGANLISIAIGAGTPVPGTPTPTRTANVTPAPTPVATQVPMASPTAGVVGGTVDFQASGEFQKPNGKMFAQDLTNAQGTLWTSSNPPVLKPPQGPPMGGVFQAVSPGCACAGVSAGGVSANPVLVGVVSLAGQPTPACPVCPTIVASPTPTPKSRVQTSAVPSENHSATTRVKGVMQWMFTGVSPVQSRMLSSPDGSLYFLTRDRLLHALDSKGHQRWMRRSGGNSIAIAPDGTLYALDGSGSMLALNAHGKPQWQNAISSTTGPLVASSNAVYIQEDNQLVAVSAPGIVKWRATARDPLTATSIADNGDVIATSQGGSVLAIGSDGSLRWSFTPQGGFSGEIAILGNRAYLGSIGGKVYAVDTTSGAQLWSYDTKAAVAQGPTVNIDGEVFFGSDALYALSPDGNLSWTKAFTGTGARSIAGDSQGGLLATVDDTTAMLNSDGSIEWATGSFRPLEQAIISSEGVLYVAAEGRVYAVK